MGSSMTVARALEVLGLSGKPSPDEIRRAYLRQVKQHPPERDRDGFQRVREAFDFLKGNPWLLDEDAGEPEPEEPEPEEPEPEEPEPEEPEPEEPEPEDDGEAIELGGPSFPNAELEQELELLDEALEHDDPVAGARAMVALYGRPALVAGPVPPPLLCLATFMVLIEREYFDEAKALLGAFESHAALHQLEAGFGTEVGARWRLAREVSAISAFDQRLAGAVARGLRKASMNGAAEQVEPEMTDRLSRDAPTIWSMLAPLVVQPPKQTPRLRDIGAWPFGVVVVVLINLMRFCVPGSSTTSLALTDDSAPSVTIADQALPAPEGAPSFSPQLTFRERAELQAEQAWRALQASLARGDCQGVADQWPLYRVAAADDVVDVATAASRKQRILEMCAELQPLLEDKP